MVDKVAIIGSTGLVGSRVTEILKEKYDIEEFNSSSGFDITSQASVSKLSKSDSKVIILFAAKTNVEECEDDKKEGQFGEAWIMNVEGVRNVVGVCRNQHKKLIYISTDFVFDGKKPIGETYTENDEPNPINWYGQTKYEGEKIVKKELEGLEYIIARISYPYRGDDFGKKIDFVRGLLAVLRSGKDMKLITDQTITPTYIDDIGYGLLKLVEVNKSETYHLVGESSLSPYEIVMKIRKKFPTNHGRLEKTTLKEYYQNLAPRPYNLAMNNDKIVSLGVKMKTFEEGLEEVKRQIQK